LQPSRESTDVAAIGTRRRWQIVGSVLATVVAFVMSDLGSQAEELRGEAHIEINAARDEDPIRHAWTFVIPPTPAFDFAASKER
jgi:hypothetical protein